MIAYFNQVYIIKNFKNDFFQRTVFGLHIIFESTKLSSQCFHDHFFSVDYKFSQSIRIYRLKKIIRGH